MNQFKMQKQLSYGGRETGVVESATAYKIVRKYHKTTLQTKRGKDDNQEKLRKPGSPKLIMTCVFHSLVAYLSFTQLIVQYSKSIHIWDL